MIFGNKNDLEDQGQRQVNLVEGAKFAQENGKSFANIYDRYVSVAYSNVCVSMMFLECLFAEGSARKGTNID